MVLLTVNYFGKMLLCKCLTGFRSSRPDVFCKKDVPKNFAKFTGRNLCHSLTFNKVTGKKRDSGTDVFL